MPMPTLHQGTCAGCGHRTAIMTAGYGAVLVDRPVPGGQHEVAGAVIAAGASGPMATSDDPRFVVLRHPVESAALASTGYGWGDLVRQGRYVGVTNVACRACGTVFQRRRLDAPDGVGCVPGAALGVGAGAAAGLEAGVGVAALVTLACDVAARAYVRHRFAGRAAALAAEAACPGCQVDDSVPVADAGSVRCPGCGRDTLVFEAVGKS